VNVGRLASSLLSSASGRSAPALRSVRKYRLSTAYSAPIAASHGNAIKAANRPNDSPLAEKASRLVRLETGSSSDAEFARWVHAYMYGRGRMRSRAAVANTTGVSSTTVASRLSTAVVTAATAKTCTSSRRGRPRDPRASHAPQARKSPSSSHSCAITSTAARKPITGPSRCASARASRPGIAPVAMSSAAGHARNGAVTVFGVSPRFGSAPDWERLHADVRRAYDDALPLEAKLAERERAYARTDAHVVPPRVLWPWPSCASDCHGRLSAEGYHLWFLRQILELS